MSSATPAQPTAGARTGGACDLPSATTQPDPDLAAAMLLHAPTAMLQVDADGRLLWCNQAALRLCPTLQPGAGQALPTLFQPHPALQAAAPRWPPAPVLELQLHHAATESAAAPWLRVQTQALPGSDTLLLALQPWAPEAPVPLVQAGRAAATLADPDGLGAQMALSIDLGQIAFWRHDLSTNRMHYNAQAFEVLGIPPRADGLSIEEVRATIHPDDLPGVVASAEQALATGLPVDLDARYRRSDGSWRTVMTRRVLQRDAQGRPVAFVGLALDVTDRVEAQRQSDELAQRFELVTRVAGIGYWSKRLRDERALWSSELRRVFGLDERAPVPQLEEWLARHVHPDDRARVTQAFRLWIKSGREHVSAEFRILRSDGQVRQVLTQSRLETGGADPLLFGVVIDVTESRSAAQALREANERVALAARGTGLATWELDVDTGEAFWDTQMWRLRGLPPGPQAPDLAGRLATTHPEDRALVAQVNQRGLTEDGQIEAAFRVVWPDGEVRWLASRSALLRDEFTGRLRRIGVNWDITDRRTAEVVRQERELARRESQAKSQFLARISHELRTPLNAVLGFTQLLQADLPAGASAASLQGQWLQHIQSAGQHLLSLINDVLELSSAEGGAQPPALQALSLAATVAEVLALLQPLQQAQRVQVEADALPGSVLAEPTRLRQVLLNLLSNAIKFNRPGGRVWLQAEAEGPWVVLSVADTGRGMTAQQMAHLFEPFNRLGAEAEGIEGTGMGLAIVKSLVERMGGTVRADSTPGQGSRFEVRLQAAGEARWLTPAPQADAPAVATAVRATACAQASAPHQLLYIEDNPVNALIIQELVARRPGLQLHVATDGRSGVAQALALQPELVLLDMQLPDIDGHEVLRQLRAQPATAHIPCIALSANAMPEDITLALNNGMADYWTKPLDFNAFLQALDQRFGTPRAD